MWSLFVAFSISIWLKGHCCNSYSTHPVPLSSEKSFILHLQKLIRLVSQGGEMVVQLWPDQTNPFLSNMLAYMSERTERKQAYRHYSLPQMKQERQPVQFVFTKWRLLVLQRSSYHGDGLQRGCLVCPHLIPQLLGCQFPTPPFHIVSTEDPPGCRSVTAGLSVLHFKLPPPGLKHFGVCDICF